MASCREDKKESDPSGDDPDRRHQRGLPFEQLARQQLSDAARLRERILLGSLEWVAAAPGCPAMEDEVTPHAPGPRFIRFVELYEVPLRDEVRGLLRDAEVHAGLRAGTLSQGVDDELRALTEHDVPMANALSQGGPSAAALEDVLREAARRYHRAAESVLLRRLERLVDESTRSDVTKRR